jgi:hypothetical protein
VKDTFTDVNAFDDEPWWKLDVDVHGDSYTVISRRPTDPPRWVPQPPKGAGP